MTIEALKYMNDCFESLSIPYEFMQWSKKLSFPYAIGEYTETEAINEDGMESGTFLLTVTTNKSFLILEEIKEKIKDFLDGRTAILDNGSGIAVSYSTAFPVPTGEQNLNRIQINLNIKEWRC